MRKNRYRPEEIITKLRETVALCRLLRDEVAAKEPAGSPRPVGFAA